MSNILGIDLGTTYTCVAYIDSSGKPVVLKNSEGELTTPSVVFFDAKNSVVVGTSAKESSKLYPGEVVSFAKSSIGRAGAAWEIHGIRRTPEEVSSYILRKVVNDAEAALRAENKLGPDEKIQDVVITCPAYFGLSERESTRKAGEIAGLNVINIINEPTAAAISYGISHSGGEDRVVLVYDLGGGTFDITMIDIKPDAVRVICTGGDHDLGGRLWDDQVIEYLAGEFARQTGNTEDILQDPETLQELTLSAERAKKMLSARDKAPVSINYKGDRARVELTREQFDSLTADLLERTVVLTGQMLEEAAKKGYKTTGITEVLLVGGSTRMPQIQARIQQQFAAPVKVYDPDEAVAKGAALYAHHQTYFNQVLERTARQTGKSADEVKRELQSGRSDLKTLAEEASLTPEYAGDAVEIVNVTSRSFGTLAFQQADARERHEVLYNMILKNTELPAMEKRNFYTVVDGQKTVTIRVLESLSSERHAAPEEGTEIGETILELPEGLEAGSPLEIEFTLNEAGLLELKATELIRGRDVVARFETADAIPASEVRAARSRLEQSVVL